jgi:hypothetical protein
MGSGILELPIGAIKPSKNSHSSAMVFDLNLIIIGLYRYGWSRRSTNSQVHIPAHRRGAVLCSKRYEFHVHLQAISIVYLMLEPKIAYLSFVMASK